MVNLNVTEDKLFFYPGVKVNESEKSLDESIRKPPRRVLPEHEGRYKITLPSGSTERSKQILAKHAECE